MRKELFIYFLLLFSFAVSGQYQQFSSTRNSNGFNFSSSRCLSYNKDLNTILFTQRLTADWPDSAFPYVPNPTGATGYLVAKWSTDKGATWDSTCYYQNDTHYPRYPTGVIYNPLGNTQLDSAYVVGFGSTTSGSWDGMYFASARMGGSLSAVNGMHTQTQNDQQWFTLNGFNGSDSIDLSPASSAVADSTIWVCAGIVDQSLFTKGIAVIKGNLNDSVFIWSLDTVIKNEWVVNKDGNVYLIQDVQIAFQPDNSNVGYILALGVDSLDTSQEAKTTYIPMAWKTTDGGTHWNRINANYPWVFQSGGGGPNFSFYDDLLYSNIFTAFSDRPSFWNMFGGQICVDSAGYLNYVTACHKPYSVHRDSLNYSELNGGFDYDTTEVCHHPYVIHYRTNGSGSWYEKILDILESRNMIAGEAQNPWSYPANNQMGYNNRIQISRTADGGKIFFSWMDTERNDNQTDFNAPNIKPSINYMGFNVSDGLYTPCKVLSQSKTNEHGFWWMYASDIVIDSVNTFIIPYVYASQNNYPFNSSNRNDLYYVNDAILNSNEFTSNQAGNMYLLMQNCVWIDPPPSFGVKSNSLDQITSVYPNPFTNSLTIRLNKSSNCTLRLYNSSGQLVKEEKQIFSAALITIKTEDLPQGLYLLEVETVYGKERVKLVKE